MKKEFNQQEYVAKWTKENTKLITARFKNDFVDEFKEACTFLGIKQSDVIRQAAIETIAKSKNQDN